MTSKQAKVFFSLEQDEDGYPPASVESVWAHSTTKDDEYAMDNIPFFARDATLGDVVHVRCEDGCLWYAGTVRQSENSLVRVVFFEPSSKARVAERLEGLGCDVEHLEEHNIMAVNVPGSASLSDVQEYLESESVAGAVDYEEAILRQ